MAHLLAPDDADAWIWFGRRTAYLGHFRDAVEIYTRAIERFPDDARFYRHRGHRYISLRRFDDAISDLERAAILIEGRPDAIEPDGLPNAAGKPRSRLVKDPNQDQLHLTRMKKRKLKLKDWIAYLESKLIPDLDA